MKALKSQLSLLEKIAQGEFNHNDMSNRYGLRITMICNDHGFYGDLTFDFYQDGSHVLSYETKLAYQKAKPGHYTAQSERVRDEKVVKQLKDALKQLAYPVVPEQWQVVHGATGSVLYPANSDGFMSRLNYASQTAEQVPAVLEYRAAGAEEWDKEDWNCDLDTGEFDTDVAEPPVGATALGYMQGRGAA